MRLTSAGIWFFTINSLQHNYCAHLDYLHFNPVTHGQAKPVEDCPHSTFHAWVAGTVCSLDWVGSDLADALVEME